MKTINQVKQTNDYSVFTTLHGNRGVNKLHIKRLKQSFQNAYLLSPIIVNENFEIIDGQHRFEAAKLINKPINYIMCKDYGLKEVQLLNTNMKNWKKEDYLNAYCDLEYPEYLKFRKFMNQFPDFGITCCEALLLNTTTAGSISTKSIEMRSETNKAGSYHIRFFQEGDLKIRDYKLAVENANRILEIKPYYDGYYRRQFVSAMIGIFKIEHYDHNRLLDRLKANPTSLQHCANVTQYKLLIEDIYNFRSRDKVSLRY